MQKIHGMSKILADNVKRICKEQNKQMKDLAADMGIDPASLTRALNGNARLDTIQKIATALGVSMKSLFEPLDDVEGFIRIGDKIYQFNSRFELEKLLQKNKY
ncbi:Helix-turn-helix [Xylanibacter ruminicola]|uniref:Helix-turn-helix n=2 Tax=Xylanibacter ruminicola TaxID=839 RepID=A0A1M6Y6H1_XYLRU|nr:Helix-turn-helix [Xylanibacter ruminicola]